MYYNDSTLVIQVIPPHNYRRNRIEQPASGRSPFQASATACPPRAGASPAKAANSSIPFSRSFLREGISLQPSLAFHKKVPRGLYSTLHFRYRVHLYCRRVHSNFHELGQSESDWYRIHPLHFHSLQAQASLCTESYLPQRFWRVGWIFH